MKEKQKKMWFSDYIKALQDAYVETQIKVALIGFYQSQHRKEREEK